MVGRKKASIRPLAGYSGGRAPELIVLEKIREHFARLGLTLSEIAKQLDVSAGHISMVLNGQRALKLSLLIKMITVFNLNPQLLAPKGFYESEKKANQLITIPPFKGQKSFDKLLKWLRQLDTTKSGKHLELIAAYAAGMVAANEIKTKRRKK